MASVPATGRADSDAPACRPVGAPATEEEARFRPSAATSVHFSIEAASLTTAPTAAGRAPPGAPAGTPAEVVAGLVLPPRPTGQAPIAWRVKTDNPRRFLGIPRPANVGTQLQALPRAEKRRNHPGAKSSDPISSGTPLPSLSDSQPARQAPHRGFPRTGHHRPQCPSARPLALMQIQMRPSQEHFPGQLLRHLGQQPTSHPGCRPGQLRSGRQWRHTPGHFHGCQPRWQRLRQQWDQSPPCCRLEPLVQSWPRCSHCSPRWEG